MLSLFASLNTFGRIELLKDAIDVSTGAFVLGYEGSNKFRTRPIFIMTNALVPHHVCL